MGFRVYVEGLGFRDGWMFPKLEVLFCEGLLREHAFSTGDIYIYISIYMCMYICIYILT